MERGGRGEGGRGGGLATLVLGPVYGGWGQLHLGNDSIPPNYHGALATGGGDTGGRRGGEGGGGEEKEEEEG